MVKKFHPTRLSSFALNSNALLGQSIGALRYDQQPHIFRALSREIGRQAKGDKKRGRTKLAMLLLKAEAQAEELAKTYDEILKLCHPYMEEEFSVIKEDVCHMEGTHNASHWDWGGSEDFLALLQDHFARLRGKSDDTQFTEFFETLSSFFDEHVHVGNQPLSPVEILKEIKRDEFIAYLEKKYLL